MGCAGVFGGFKTPKIGFLTSDHLNIMLGMGPISFGPHRKNFYVLNQQNKKISKSPYFLSKLELRVLIDTTFEIGLSDFENGALRKIHFDQNIIFRNLRGFRAFRAQTGLPPGSGGSAQPKPIPKFLVPF